ncbi:hypothetical protein Bbelb_117610 [Branchiostoma belcheri]|nr:hypothetical protein Bbelb_117610 [Branchiostoma belcheri]
MVLTTSYSLCLTRPAPKSRCDSSRGGFPSHANKPSPDATASDFHRASPERMPTARDTLAAMELIWGSAETRFRYGIWDFAAEGVTSQQPDAPAQQQCAALFSWRSSSTSDCSFQRAGSSAPAVNMAPHRSTRLGWVLLLIGFALGTVTPRTDESFSGQVSHYQEMKVTPRTGESLPGQVSHSQGRRVTLRTGESLSGQVSHSQDRGRVWGRVAYWQSARLGIKRSRVGVLTCHRSINYTLTHLLDSWQWLCIFEGARDRAVDDQALTCP